MRVGSRRPGPPITNGWTTFPDTDGTAIYVSQSTGNDITGTGAIGAPYATLSKGVTILNGLTADKPHRLYLKAGDVWTNEVFGQIKVGGKSYAEPLVIGAYGDGARPLIKTTANTTVLSFLNTGGGASGGNYTAIVGLEFYAHTRDPDSGTFAGSGTGAIALLHLNAGSWFLIEDCKASFYSDNLLIETGTKKNVWLRRNIVVDAYPINDAAHSQGIYVDSIDALFAEENFFDHNGWNTSGALTGAGATIFNHNMYFKTNGPATVRSNISARASSHGLQQRGGGLCQNNLLVANPIGIIVGDVDSAAAFWRNAKTEYNVITEGGEIDGADRNWGIELFNCISNGSQCSNNIIANQSASSVAATGILIDSGSTGGAAANNIIYNWGAGIGGDGAGNYTTTPNKVDLNADNAEGYNFSAPSRSVGSYFGTQGETATLAAFLAWHRARARGTWTEAYGANAVNNYIRAGFDMAAI